MKSPKNNKMKGQKPSRKFTEGHMKRSPRKSSVASPAANSSTVDSPNKAQYRDKSSPGSVSSKGTAATARSSSSMSYALETPDASPSGRKGLSPSKKLARKLDLSVLSIDGSTKKKVKNHGTGRKKASSGTGKTTKTTKKTEPVETECFEYVDMSLDDDVNGHRTSSSFESGDDESGGEDVPKVLEAHHFQWHTEEGLSKGLSFHYGKDDFMNKSTGQKIDLLVKNYSPTQQRPVFMLLCVPLNRDPMDLNLNAITTKMKAGTMLKQLILPAIEGNDSDVDSGNGGKR